MTADDSGLYAAFGLDPDNPKDRLLAMTIWGEDDEFEEAMDAALGPRKEKENK